MGSVIHQSKVSVTMRLLALDFELFIGDRDQKEEELTKDAI